MKTVMRIKIIIRKMMFINHGTFYPYYVYITTEQQLELLRWKTSSIKKIL